MLVDGWDNARWGKNCKIIKCQEAKGVRFCYECGVYPDCKRFHLIADHSLKRGEDLVANLAKIKAGKVEEWLEKEDRKGRCPKCGKPVSLYINECHWCGADTRKAKVS